MKKENKKESLITDLKFLQESKKNKDYNSHLLFGMDADDDGTPAACVLMTQGKTLELIGMIDSSMETLKKLKKTLLKKTQPDRNDNFKQLTDDLLDPRVKKMIDMLPDDVKDKVLDIKKRMDEAYMNDDTDALKKLSEELDALKFFNVDNDDSEDNEGSEDDFNINDFK
jgi:hypothetical protein